MATMKQLVESEISDFFAIFGSPGEPVTIEEAQKTLLYRVSPLLSTDMAWVKCAERLPETHEQVLVNDLNGEGVLIAWRAEWQSVSGPTGKLSMMTYESKSGFHTPPHHPDATDSQL